MKRYSFAKITVTHFPNLCDVNNRWIFTPDICAVVNVSQRVDEKVKEAIIGKGMEYCHFPLSEETADIGWNNILQAVKTIHRYDSENKHLLVHCDGGTHRSRLVVEAYHFAKYGTHLKDEYKGYGNHLIYDCSEEHLLPLQDAEKILSNCL